MEISEYDGSKLRLILIGMITDTKVCSRISTLVTKPGGPRFSDKWASLISKWCCDHLEKYQEPPNGNIEIIFHKWVDNTKADRKTIDQIETLLDYLSSEYSGGTEGNSDFILDLASEYFNQKNLRSVVEEVEDRLTTGQMEEAYSELSSTSKIELGYSTVLNPLQDVEVWLRAFEEDREKPLFEYPGALGELVGQSFVRSTLFAFQGVDKVGKSFYLLDAAVRALKNRHRVAYFECGDLGQDETIQRLGQRILRVPLFPDYVDWPTGWDTETPGRPTTTRKRKDGVSIGHAIKLMRKHTRDRDIFRVSCHPNSSISVAGIETLLQEWAMEGGWIPDLVVIDYADILQLPNKPDVNEQIDLVWKHLRRMSQNFNCCVLTATQSGAQAYRSKSSVLTRKDFQGRRTKFAEVNGMLGLNANDFDMQNGVTRVNWIVRRKGRWSVNQQVAVAGCMAAGTPIVVSEWVKHTKANGDSDNSKEE